MSDQEAPYLEVSINLGLAVGLSEQEIAARLERKFTPDELSTLADKDINEFEQHFQRELKNDEPLTRGEKAIIKTFLHYHLVTKPHRLLVTTKE